jgi:hypothetical protein
MCYLGPLPTLLLLACGADVMPRAVDMCVGPDLDACAALEDGRVACLNGPNGGFVVDLDAVSVECGINGQLCVESRDGTIKCWDLWGYQSEAGQESIQPDEDALPFVHWRYEWGRGCGIQKNGRLSCWGPDAYDIAPFVMRPVRDVTMTQSCHAYISEAGEIGVRQGELAACGQDRELRGMPIGDGTSNFTTSELDGEPRGSDWRQVSGGAHHACALDSDGMATCWGWWSWEDVTPQDVRFSQLSSTYHGTCGVTDEGGLRCWEQYWDSEESISDGLTIFDHERGYGWYNWIKSDVPFTDGWVQVGLTPDYGCGLDIAGQIRCFGAFPPVATLESTLKYPLDEPPCVPDSYFGTVCP